MGKAVLFALFLLLPYLSVAQAIAGRVVNSEQLTGISGVVILNVNSGASTRSDENGNFDIVAVNHDSIVFRHLSYKIVAVIAGEISGSLNMVPMEPIVRKLKEATIHGLTKYQKDSIANYKQFEHQLTKVIVPKPKIGLGCSGCIGWLADKITGNSKKQKQFKKTFASEDQQKFIDSRYTVELVGRLTNLTDTSSIITFINVFPMDYSFARAATDLELKAWIRSSYRKHMASGTQKTN